MSPSKAHLCIPTAWLLTRFQLVMLEEMIEPFIAKGPSIKYVTLFLTNFYPSPCHTLSHVSGPPLKYVTHLGLLPAIFSSTEIVKKNPIQNLSQWYARFLFGGLFWVFCLEGLSGVVFVRSPFCQNTSVSTES